MADDFIRCCQNILCRTVILLQTNHLRIRIDLLEAQYVLDICTAEPVNRLIVIADHTEIPVLGCQQAHQLKLRCICILILIDHDKTETILILFQYLRILLK